MEEEIKEVIDIFNSSKTSYLYIFPLFDKKAFFFKIKNRFPNKSINELNDLLLNVDKHYLKINGKEILKSKKATDYLSLKREYDGYSLFFDNELTNFTNKDQCPKVIDLQVKCRPRTYDNKLSAIKEVKSYLSKLSSKGQDFGIALIRLQGNIQNYDPTSGINNKHFIYLEKILMQEHLVLKYIFLDWDRTFTVFEGINIYLDRINRLIQEENKKGDEINLVTWEGMSEYFLGGKERINKIKTLLEKCKSKNIEIFILTNNTSMNNRIGNRHYNNGSTIKQIIKHSVGHDLIPEKNVIYNSYGDKYITMAKMFPILAEQKVNEKEAKEIEYIRNTILDKRLTF